MEIKENIASSLAGLKAPNMSLGQYIYQRLRGFGDNVVQVDVQTGKQLTYEQLLKKSVLLATILNEYRVQIEDRVSIASENHPNYLVTMCASLFVGATWAPLNPDYTEREYRHMLDIYQPRIMFVTHRTEKMMRKIAPTLSWPMRLIQVEDQPLFEQTVTLKQLLEKHKDTVDPYAFEPTPIDDHATRIATILGSSGTTGFPKGVMLSHRNFLSFIFNTRVPAYLDCRPADRVILFLPMFHGYAFGLINIWICTGGTIYVMRRFEPVAFFKSIGDYKITHLPLVPPVLVILAKHPMVENYDFSSVRELLSGAAPLQKTVWEEAKRRTKMKYIRNGYGMTELSVISNMSDRTSSDDNVGAAIPGFRCKIVDPSTGNTLGPRRVGEVCFKGEQVMLGYFRNRKVTAETIDQDNWCHTGDLGYLNEHGVLYITGRIKELIKYKGFQVSPSEIEAVILSHPSVKDVAVVGKADELNGEIPVAFVVKQPGNKSLSAKDIVTFANGNLSPQKWLRGGVQFVEGIPKTPSGKILRRELIVVDSERVEMSDDEKNRKREELKRPGNCHTTIGHIVMGHLFSTNHILDEEMLTTYAELTYLRRDEILAILKRLDDTDPGKIAENPQHRFTVKQIGTILPQIKHSPFHDSICRVFSSKRDGHLGLEDVLDLCSAFSGNAPENVRAAWAFRIFDLDGDNEISANDLIEIVRRLTRNEENEHERVDTAVVDAERVAQLVLEEMLFNQLTSISLEEFVHYSSRMSEFSSTFRLNI